MQGKTTSKPIDESRITEIATEVNGAFAKDFPWAFKNEIIEDVRQIPRTIKNNLMEAPIPTHSMKKGYLLKRGDNVKNWKRRYFIASNKADNYLIAYSEDVAGMVVKGRIYCYGYVTGLEIFVL